MSDRGGDLYCGKCNISFDSENGLLKHRQEKHVKNTIKCFKCKLTFSNQEAFRLHWNKKHVAATTTTTTTKSSTSVQPSTSSANGSITIDESDEESTDDPLPSTSNGAANKQKRIHKMPTSNRCNACFRFFQTRSHAEVHYRRVHMDWIVTCIVCGISIKHKLYRQHLTGHKIRGEKKEPGAKKGVKKIVPKPIKTVAQKIVQKSRNAHFKKETKCPTCEEIFDSRTNMQIHYRQTHGTQTAPFRKETKCLKCEEIFESYRKMKIHYRQAHSTRNAHFKKETKCPKCEEMFDSCTNMKIHHRQTHSKARDVAPKITFDECSICKKNLPSRFAAIQHYKNLHSITVQSCPNCDLGFVHRATLLAHWNRKHPDIPKPEGFIIKQKIAEKKLENGNAAAVTQLPVIRSILDLRATLPDISIQSKVCPLCKKTFSSRNSAEKHYKEVHRKENIEKCTLCFTKFATKGNLRVHFITAHKNFPLPQELAPQQKTNEVQMEQEEEGQCSESKAVEQSPKVKGNSLLKMFDKIRERNAQSPPQIRAPVAAEDLQEDDDVEMEDSCFTLNLEKCAPCKKSFNSRNAATMHYNNKHPNEMQICPECDMLIASSRNMAYHWKTKHETMEIPIHLRSVRSHGFMSDLIRSFRLKTCEICILSFSSLIECRRHFIDDHEITFELCSVCHKGFTSDQNLRFHWNKCHSELTFEKFKEEDAQIAIKKESAEMLPKAPSTPIGAKRFIFPFITSNACPLCDVVRPTRKNILVHYKSHLKPGIKCTQCNQRYAIKKHLKEHWLLAHTDVPFDESIEEQNKENQSSTNNQQATNENKLDQSPENTSNINFLPPRVEVVVSLVRLQDDDTLPPEVRKQFLEISEEIVKVKSEPSPESKQEHAFVTLERKEDPSFSQKVEPLNLSTFNKEQTDLLIKMEVKDEPEIDYEMPNTEQSDSINNTSMPSTLATNNKSLFDYGFVVKEEPN